VETVILILCLWWQDLVAEAVHQTLQHLLGVRLSGTAAGTAEPAARIIPRRRVAAAAQVVIPGTAELAAASPPLGAAEPAAVRAAAVQVAALTPRALVAVLEFTEREQTELAVLTQAVTATPEPAVLAVKTAQ
jgi:hypothetical protein